MRKLAITFGVGVLLAAGVYLYSDKLGINPLAQFDLTRYCRFASEYKFAPKEDLAARVGDMYALAKFALFSETATNIRAASFSVAQSERWELFKKGAAQVGLKDFQCPALKTYFEDPAYNY